VQHFGFQESRRLPTANADAKPAAVILILDTQLFSRAANIAARTTGIPPPPRPLRRSIASALLTTAEQFGFPQIEFSTDHFWREAAVDAPRG
jgi:hypothetical protein